MIALELVSVTNTTMSMAENQVLLIVSICVILYPGICCCYSCVSSITGTLVFVTGTLVFVTGTCLLLVPLNVSACHSCVQHVNVMLFRFCVSLLLLFAMRH